MSAPSPTSPPASGNSTAAPPPSTPATPPPSTPAAPPPSTPASSPPPPAAASSPPPAAAAGSPPPAAAAGSPPAGSSPPATPSTPPTGTPSAPSLTGKPSLSPPATQSPPTGQNVPAVQSPPPESPQSSGGSGSPVSLAVGVAIGGLVALLIFSILCLCCWRKQKKKKGSHSSRHHFHPEAPPAPYKADPYGGAVQNWQQNVTPAGQMFHMPPPQTSPPPSYPSRPPHASPLHASATPYAYNAPQTIPPPVPSPMINGSGGSGNNYSAGELQPSPSAVSVGFSKSTFTYEELVAATDGFCDANLLGQGGFGYVHRGVLPNGKEIAVKQLKSGSCQGEREFQAEVEIISRVHHRHLVSLVGYCISGGGRLLVYEFVPNNTLEFHLHGKGRPTMEWPMRLKIALGSAKGLAYLHEDCHPKIIHRDIKASNILLDFKFESKVADFGLAKLTSENNTHVSTRVMGTFGYLAPEYASSGKLTEKSDVFSFGVMMLELITGRRPVDMSQSYMEDSLVDWARPLLTRALEDGNFEPLVDPQLGKNYNANEMARMIACAAACVRHSARRRPRMSQVVRALEGDVNLDDLNEGVIPGHSRVVGSYTSSDYDSGQYLDDMKKFKKLALPSKDYPSSQYSGPTSEYGQNRSGSSSEGRQTQDMELTKTKEEREEKHPAGRNPLDF